MAAVASTLVLSKYNSSPQTNPAAAQFHDVLKQLLEDFHDITFSDFAQAAVVRHGFIQVMADKPAEDQVQSDRLHQVSLRPDALEEGDELKFEEGHGIDEIEVSD